MILAVFRSRTQLFRFLDVLRSLGGNASVVSTPQEASVGCGLSARFEETDLPEARTAANALRESFVGFYKTNGNYGKKIVKLP